MRSKLLLFALPVLLVAARPHGNPPAKAPAKTAARGPATVFARFNLAPLWRFSASENESKVHNGFFGYTYQRLEMVFLSVRRDEHNPAIYHVRGKDRRYDIVRSFAGTFTLDAIRRSTANNNYPTIKASQSKDYEATGRFVLRETPRVHDEAHGTFRGQLAVDLTRDPAGRLSLNSTTSNELTQHGGFTFDGSWTDAGTGAALDVLVKNGGTVTYRVLDDFDIGGRSPVINGK